MKNLHLLGDYNSMDNWNLLASEIKDDDITGLDGITLIEGQEQDITSIVSRFHTSTEHNDNWTL